MPNRIIRDWTDSEVIDILSVYAERFFTRLIMKVDDYGRYSANVKLLKSTLFPLKTDIREADISLWLTECEKCGLIALYSVAQKDYLQINNFKQKLRQKLEKYPSADLCTTSALHLHSTRIADDQQTHINGVPETKGNEVETETKMKGPPPEFISELKADEILRDKMCMNWDLTKQAQQKMIDTFILSCISRGKVHYDFNDFKSHFFSWSAKQYMDFKEKKKQMVD
jgi:hypothetical protein